MTSFGTFRLAYESPENTIEGDMEMTISSEADMGQMLDLFTAFLRAAGYPIKFGSKLAFQTERPNLSYDDIVTFTSNSTFPAADFASSDYGMYIGSGVRGGMGQDVVTF